MDADSIISAIMIAGGIGMLAGALIGFAAGAEARPKNTQNDER